MIIYKILGAGLILTSSLAVCMQGRAYEKRRLAQLGAYIELLTYIKNQIECYLLPIDKIIDRADPTLLRQCGIVGKQSTVREASGGSLLIPESVYRGSRLSELLERFCKEFGAVYGEEQIKACERYIGELTQEYKNLGEKQNKDAHMRLTLLVSASLSLILMLV